MPSQVTLTVTEGRFKGQEIIFTERTTCSIGRGDDCNLQLLDLMKQQAKILSIQQALLSAI
ncbi:hypothetical protein [Merismopedia glauca]|uniref:Uncharacterized protein n=1 Tax=Merismopedia glauca CCAP 1448/3 TaxID=1296344 RepID=A0A2T1C387_9CYAN|nr:hypothetical protein [Merismopedia glauca]PSB02607.1 hypothetical protein C7B64_12220 [Merismopedia glauca CCAP 1448/3]